MKTYEETVRAVLEKRDAIEKQKKERNRKLRRTLIPSFCGCIVILAAAAGIRYGVLQKKDPLLPAQTAAENTSPALAAEGSTRLPEEGVAETESEPAATGAPAPTEAAVSQGYAVPVPNDTPQAAETASAPVQAPKSEDGTYADGQSGVGGNYFAVPMVPRDREILATGERITDDEAAAYFAARKSGIASTLAASGTAADDLRISAKGYCHVSYTGLEGERLEVRENFRDYLVYNGETLVAIITLTKENGVLHDTPSLGAPWFAGYNDFLNAHRGEALVYVYASGAEIILTPDGGMYSPLPAIYPEIYMEGVEDPYRVFYHPDNVYVP